MQQVNGLAECMIMQVKIVEDEKIVENIRLFVECIGVMFLSFGILYGVQSGITKIFKMVWSEIKVSKVEK